MVSTRLSRLEGHRRKFMAVIDNTPECSRAVHYAGRRAKNSNGGLVLIYVIPEGDFQQWLGVEEIMRAEAREEAEAVMAKAAQTVRETIGIEPEIVIREGNSTTAINSLIEEDRDIAILVWRPVRLGGPGTAGLDDRRARCRIPDPRDRPAGFPHQ
jgi:nucleotide-binding universal stress UspA family protein